MFEVKITVDETVDVVAFFRSLSVDAIIKSWESVSDEIMITLWFMDLDSAKHFCWYWFEGDEDDISYVDGPEDETL